MYFRSFLPKDEDKLFGDTASYLFADRLGLSGFFRSNYTNQISDRRVCQKHRRYDDVTTDIHFLKYGL